PPSPTISGAYRGPRKPDPYALWLRPRNGATLTNPGNSASSAPSSFDTSAPSDGYSIGPCGTYPVRSRYVARPWSPSLLFRDRPVAGCAGGLPGCGRASVMRRPGTLVSAAANGPPLACPGFRSNVSIWLGPPLIHKRTHDRLRCGFFASSAASASSQPDDE